MGELWDIYDINRKKTGRKAQRDVYEFKKGEYHIVVSAVILNSKNQILISKRAEHKKSAGMWELNGGSVLAGETSLEGILRELREELGIEFTKKEAIYFKEEPSITYPNFKDMWLFRKDIKIEDITFPDGEAVAAKWVTIEEFMEMFNRKEIIQVVDFNEEDYKKAIQLKQREAYSYIGKNVHVEIDRELGSKHPKYEFKYPVNYGYIPNTISGDGEEIDCYILGVESPVKSFDGKCIAVIHRTNDDDDKLVVVPEGKEISDDEIKKSTNFQEQYFESEIIR